MTDHLDLRVSVGGKYVRCTMSDRNDRDVFAFKEVEAGLYDFEQWNDEYWRRLTFFLDDTSAVSFGITLGAWVDREGGIWFPNASQIHYFPLQSIDANAVPVYTADSKVTYDTPSGINARRIRYCSAGDPTGLTDVMIIGGDKESHPKDHWKVMGRVARRYDNWKGTRTLAWEKLLPGSGFLSSCGCPQLIACLIAFQPPYPGSASQNGRNEPAPDDFAGRRTHERDQQWS
jgi:hypothetical protein